MCWKTNKTTYILISYSRLTCFCLKDLTQPLDRQIGYKQKLMKQKQFSSKSEKNLIPLNKISFKQAIQKIESNTFKQDLQRKKQLSLKNKHRHQWLERVNIMPPYLTLDQRQKIFRSTNCFSHKDTDYFKIFKHNCYRKDLEFDMELLFPKKNLQIQTSFNQISPEKSHGMHSCKSGGDSPHNLLKAFRKRKFKENWKLTSRRDQLNILRFSISTPKNKNLDKTPQKTQYPISPESPVQKNPKPKGMMYIKMEEVEEQSNRLNETSLLNEKKAEKKFRLKPQKSKTSLVISKNYNFDFTEKSSSLKSSQFQSIKQTETI